MIVLRLIFIWSIILFSAAGWAHAAEGPKPRILKIGTEQDVSAIDPHYHNIPSNVMLSQHIYDRLINYEQNQLTPGLATSWRNINDNLWEITIRDDVMFHNGMPLKPEDIEFSIERAKTQIRSPSSFSSYLKAIDDIKIINPTTLHFVTTEPVPLLPVYLTFIAIIPSDLGSQVKTYEFQSPKVAVGTGPYQFVSWAPGDRIMLKKNPHYWGKAPEWDEVIIRPFSNATARLAALFSGDVDIIDMVPAYAVKKLRKHKDLKVTLGTSSRLIYLHLDQFRDRSPYLTDNNGQALTKNPFKDIRVRQALSLAINRQNIVEQVMEGMAIPTGQLVPSQLQGYAPSLPPPPFNPEHAKQLLTEAGYPEGFQVTLHTPNDRYQNDEQIANAVAEMLHEIGIKVRVATLPQSIFFTKASLLDFTFILGGWSSGTGDSSSPLRSLVHSYDKKIGLGVANRGRYSNPDVDQLIQSALTTIESKKREKLLQQATRLAMDEVSIIPLHFQVNAWAMRANLTYTPKRMSGTWAHAVDICCEQMR